MNTLFCAYYLAPALNSKARHRVVETIVHILKNKIGLDNFDAIAVCGTSGMLIGPIIAYLLNKEIIVVRKKLDAERSNCHSNHTVEFSLDHELEHKYVIIDDLISRGYTVSRIIEQLSLKSNFSCAGIILWNTTSGVFSVCSPFEASTPVYGFYGYDILLQNYITIFDSNYNSEDFVF